MCPAYHVLYVDDEPELLEIAKFFLESGGVFLVATATSAKDVLDGRDLSMYDAIISDYQMPVMDGITFLKRVRSDFGDVPFILFTGRGREDVVIEAIDNGADFYVQKGGDPESQFVELKHKITRAIERKVSAKELKEGREQLSEIIGFFPDATLAIDADKRVIIWNHAIEEMTGIPASDMIGRGDYLYTVPFYGIARPQIMDLLFDPDHFIASEYPQIQKEGDSLIIETFCPALYGGKGAYVSAKASPLRDSTGNIVGAIESIRDITGRKQSEEALQVSEERLGLAIDVAQMGTWDLDLARHTAWRSPRHDQIFGYDSLLPEWTYEMFLEHVLPEDRDFVDKAFREAQKDRHDWEFECRIRRTDGQVRWIWAKGRILPGSCNIPERMLGLVQDITRRKNMTEQINLDKSFMDAIFYSIPGMLYLYDEEGNLVRWNKKHELMTGYSPEELSHMHLQDWYKGDDESQKAVAEGVKRTIQNGFGEAEAVLQRKDGTGIPMYLTACPLTINGKQYFTGIGIDISERLRAEAELKKSRKQLMEAMDLAHLVNWEFDVATGVFTFDDRFYSMYGTTVEREGSSQMTAEVYAREFVHPEDQHLVANEVRKAINATDPGYVSQVEHRIVRRDGEIRYIIVRYGITKDNEGRTIRTHGANQDITERKRAENALRQANRQLKLLSGVTRHDILNKVAVVQGYLRVAEKSHKNPLMSEYIGKIQSMMNSIQAQIEFTRIYQDLGTNEPQWQELGRILLRFPIPEPIVMKVNVNGINVYADPMLERVFSNLLDNSIRHGGHVTEIRVFSSIAEQGLTVTWEDNGIGIPAGEKEQIFERGFGRNTGLGLFLVREILSLTEASIKETGCEGAGSRFEILVPEGKWRIREKNPAS